MSREVTLEERAISQAARFLQDDPEGLRLVFEVIDRLGTDPYPERSSPFGSPNLRRLRIGRYRVLYAVSDDRISIGHIARAPAAR